MQRQGPRCIELNHLWVSCNACHRCDVHCCFSACFYLGWDIYAWVNMSACVFDIYPQWNWSLRDISKGEKRIMRRGLQFRVSLFLFWVSWFGLVPITYIAVWSLWSTIGTLLLHVDIIAPDSASASALPIQGGKWPHTRHTTAIFAYAYGRPNLQSSQHLPSVSFNYSLHSFNFNPKQAWDKTLLPIIYFPTSMDSS